MTDDKLYHADYVRDLEGRLFEAERERDQLIKNHTQFAFDVGQRMAELTQLVAEGKGRARERLRVKINDELVAINQRLSNPERIARWFHEEYERRAGDFNYTTRETSAVPWKNVPEDNRKLMVATVTAVILRIRGMTSGKEDDE